MPRSQKLHLRFDKVVLRVSQRLNLGLLPSQAQGRLVVVTMTAPIRQAAKTTAIVDDRIRTLVARSPMRRAARATVHGNHVSMQLIARRLPGAPAVLLFVHNPGTDPRVFFDMTREWTELLRKRAQTLRTACLYSSGALDAYRHLAAKLGLPAGMKSVSIAFADGRVERLRR